MNEPKFYRPRSIRGGCFLFIGAFFAIFGLLGIYAPWQSWWFFGLFFALGSLGVVFGYATLRMGVLVDDFGITKIYRLGDGFRAPWDDIEAWLVTPCDVTDRQKVYSKLYAGNPPQLMPLGLLNPDDSFTFQAAIFKLRNKRWPVVVYDCEASRPSFDAFVEDIRAHASEKEVTAE
jgi:hypothetical protein